MIANRYDACLAPIAPVTGNKIAIVGAGIAGLCMADALISAKPTLDITVFERSTGPAVGASGNPLGYLSPRTGKTVTPTLRFFAESWQYARQYYAENPYFEDRPLLFLAKNAQHFVRLKAYHQTGLIRSELLDHSQLAERLMPHTIKNGAGGLYLPGSGVVKPLQLVQHLATSIKEKISIEYNKIIERVEDLNRQFDAVILCSGGNMLQDSLHLPIDFYRGQISWLSTNEMQGTIRPLPVLTGDGYVCQTEELTCFGASFEKINGYRHSVENSDQDTHSNMEKLRALLEVDAHHIDFSKIKGRAAVRATSPDRLPYCGQMPDIAANCEQYHDLHLGQHWQDLPNGRNLDKMYVLGGLGARGFTTAPYLARLLALALTGQELTESERTFMALVHPARFLISDLRRAKPDRRWYKA